MHSQNIPRHSLKTFLDALGEFCKYLLNAFKNPQATFRTLRKLSGNSLRHWKHHLETFSELSGHTLEIHQIFPRCSFRNSQATFLTLRKHSGNSLRHWKHSLETLRQLSGHSGTS